MKRNFIFVIVFFLGNVSASESLRGVGGSLLFEDRLNEGFQRVVYKMASGKILNPFDVRLFFYYSLESLSPDKKKSVVQFSGKGVLEDAAGGLVEGRSSYMCAFIRMTDGCIVQVAEGEVCGGSWSDSGDWVTSIYADGKHFFEGGPSVTEIYKQYMKKNTQLGGGARLYSILQEGTSIENIFACDPLQDNNKNVYFNLLKALQVDGDISEAVKLERLLN